jgi:LmbE family N-acetylglucosaminyl deacetylase
MNFIHPSRSPLHNSSTLPWLSLGTLSPGPVLVVAPHPDDETLGCGGAIAQLHQLGYPVLVLVISDGTASHPRSRKYPPPRLRALRQTETREALSCLGVSSTAVKFLDLPDGDLATLETSVLQQGITQCCLYLESLAPQTIFLPLRSDPHPDHRATWHLLHTALLKTQQSPRRIEYPIWDWDPAQHSNPSQTRSLSAWRLDIQAVLALKQRAIAAYRSQTTHLIDDDPQGFRLTPEMLSHFTRPWEVYLEELP